jgi:hypothetical protein
MCTFFCVYVVLCLGRGLATSWLPSNESYRLWMIKKLRNQPYAPKWEQAPQVGARGENKFILRPSSSEDFFH